jgi:RNA polymerase sigma factor (sigma-70 family)
MQELDDISLLREYVNHESEDAFAALVARHVNKVYSIALRHARNPHQAEEITQAVFVILARKARRLGGQVILSGLLCRTAQLTAVTFVRSETRRARREQEAYMRNPLVETDSDVWPQIEPLLDAAMARLSEADHHALVLRFFDGKSMKEVGAALGASEDAAKMRVNRAVEKLRLFFSRRGIVVSVAILTAAISANSVQSAPATLAKSATTLALAKGATASTSTLTLIKGVLKIMAWTKAKTAIVAGAVTLLVTGTATVVVKKASHPIPPSAQPLTAQFHPGLPVRDAQPVLPDGGQTHPVPEHSPNARFANLTPQQRVQQARRHYPQSLDDLQKSLNSHSTHE